MFKANSQIDIIDETTNRFAIGRSLIMLVGFVLVIELATMLFSYYFLATVPEWLLIILNCLILATLLMPFLYLYFYRPISLESEQQHKAQIAMKQALEDVNQIFNTAADGMRVVDKNFNVLKVNKTFLELAGVSEVEAINKKCYEVFGGSACRTNECRLTKILRGSKYVHEEADKQCADGKLVPCVVIATPYTNLDGELLGIIEDFKDITEWKRAEELTKQHNMLMKSELEQAAIVQRQLLPMDLPQMLGINFSWQLIPCVFMAGDMLNVFHLDDNQMAFYILDVKGHGVAAALAAVAASYLLKPSTTETILRPSIVLTQLNSRLSEGSDENFITVFYGVLDIEELTLTYARAGHCPPLLISVDDEIRELDHGDLPVGIYKTLDYEDYQITLQRGDKLILYTDGIIETENSSGQFFTKMRLIETVQQNKDICISDLTELIIRGALDHAEGQKIQDDISILGIEITS